MSLKNQPCLLNRPVGSTRFVFDLDRRLFDSKESITFIDLVVDASCDTFIELVVNGSCDPLRGTPFGAPPSTDTGVTVSFNGYTAWGLGRAGCCLFGKR